MTFSNYDRYLGMVMLLWLCYKKSLVCDIHSEMYMD